LISRHSSSECEHILVGTVNSKTFRSRNSNSERQIELSGLGDGAFLLRSSSWDGTVPNGERKPLRIKAWLRVEGDNFGSKIEMRIAARSAASLWIYRWGLPALAIASWLIALVEPSTRTTLAVLGAAVWGGICLTAIVMRHSKPTVVAESEALIIGTAEALRAEIVPVMAGCKRGSLFSPVFRHYGVWGDVSNEDLFTRSGLLKNRQ
jgi:hypothetical protein